MPLVPRLRPAAVLHGILRHVPHRTAGALAPLNEPIKAPGLTAAVRRHPDGVRRGAAGAIAGGLVLFVVASVTNAGAQTSRPSHPAAAPAFTVAPDPTFPLDEPVIVTSSAAPAPAPTPAAKAPVTSAVITDLAANGIPTVALNAYRVAAARLAHAEPSCGIDWALLAGIGREESDHGQFGGAVLSANGESTPHIIGIPLNGVGTALIRDTDHGALDGDTVYDRAVGPMQFIPSTWALWGTDANGDGVADPFNIDDAALTSARYLCAAGGNLRTTAGQTAAVLAYNESDQYLAQVLALADAYRRGISVSGLPVGNVSGNLPPVKSAGALPPANPGAPTANQPPAVKPATAPAATSTPAAAGSPSAPGSTPPGSSTTASKPAGTPTSSQAAGSTSSSTPKPAPSGSGSASANNGCPLIGLLDPSACATPSG